MPQLFLSHSSSDEQLIRERVLAPLAGVGVSVWYSENVISSASDWERTIQKGLDECTWFAVCLTPNALSSRWVKAEVDWAFEHRTEKVIPLILIHCEWRKLHLLLRTVQAVHVNNDSDAWLQEVLRPIGSSFYRFVEDIRKEEMNTPEDEVVARNRRWDKFCELIQTLPRDECLARQIKYNQKASKRLGLEIADVKLQLRMLGYFEGQIDNSVDGHFVDCISRFQRRNNLRHIDGIFEDLTYLAMEALARQRGLL